MAKKRTSQEPPLIEELREAIRRDGRTLYKLAQDSGVGNDQLYRFMSGERTLRLPAVAQLFQALNVRVVFPTPAEPVPPASQPAPSARSRQKKTDV